MTFEELKVKYERLDCKLIGSYKRVSVVFLTPETCQMIDYNYMGFHKYNENKGGQPFGQRKFFYPKP